MEILRTGGHGGGGAWLQDEQDRSRFSIIEALVPVGTGVARIPAVGPCVLLPGDEKCVSAADFGAGAEMGVMKGAAGSVGSAAGRGTATVAPALLRLTASETWGKIKSLPGHFKKHGSEFGAKSTEEYASMASEFLQRGIRNRLPTKVDPKTGIVRVYDPKENTLGAYNPDGSTRTFFKPDPSKHQKSTNWDYWLDQPGHEL
jgi:hypothetical protein